MNYYLESFCYQGCGKIAPTTLSEFFDPKENKPHRFAQDWERAWSPLTFESPEAALMYVRLNLLKDRQCFLNDSRSRIMSADNDGITISEHYKITKDWID